MTGQTSTDRELVLLVMTNEELNLHRFKLKQAQHLTDENEHVGLEIYSKLLKRTATPHREQLLFSIKKLEQS